MKAKFMLAMQGASAYVNMTDSFLEKAAGTLTGTSTLSLHAAYLDLTRYPPRSEHVCTPHLRLRMRPTMRRQVLIIRPSLPLS